MYLDNFASKFASTGFVVTVFDYRFFGGSEGEPRAQLLWPEQIQDYRNAITWTMAQKEVDPARIGVWGTSYSGGHVIFLGAYDRRIKAVVAQVPVTDVWDTYMAKWPQQQRPQISPRCGRCRSGMNPSWNYPSRLRRGSTRWSSIRWIRT
jgi:acetyl esterase/lipase